MHALVVEKSKNFVRLQHESTKKIWQSNLNLSLMVVKKKQNCIENLLYFTYICARVQMASKTSHMKTCHRKCAPRSIAGFIR